MRQQLLEDQLNNTPRTHRSSHHNKSSRSSVSSHSSVDDSSGKSDREDGKKMDYAGMVPPGMTFSMTGPQRWNQSQYRPEYDNQIHHMPSQFTSQRDWFGSYQEDIAKQEHEMKQQTRWVGFNMEGGDKQEQEKHHSIDSDPQFQNIIGKIKEHVDRKPAPFLANTQSQLNTPRVKTETNETQEPQQNMPPKEPSLKTGEKDIGNKQQEPLQNNANLTGKPPKGSQGTGLPAPQQQTRSNIPMKGMKEPRQHRNFHPEIYKI